MWVVPAKPNCYGKMFPDLKKGESEGEVFQLRRLQGSPPAVNVEEAKWEGCQRCHYYHHCYDLGMAIVSLLNASEPAQGRLDR